MKNRKKFITIFLCFSLLVGCNNSSNNTTTVTHAESLQEYFENVQILAFEENLSYSEQETFAESLNELRGSSKLKDWETLIIDDIKNKTKNQKQIKALLDNLEAAGYYSENIKSQFIEYFNINTITDMILSGDVIGALKKIDTVMLDYSSYNLYRGCEGLKFDTIFSAIQEHYTKGNLESGYYDHVKRKDSRSNDGLITTTETNTYLGDFCYSVLSLKTTANGGHIRSEFSLYYKGQNINETRTSVYNKPDDMERTDAIYINEETGEFFMYFEDNKEIITNFVDFRITSSGIQ